jgi:hypothetical protein
VNIFNFLSSPTEATLPGSEVPIRMEELREAQISLCQHAPAVTKGVERVLPIHIKWFEVVKQIIFTKAEELALGNPFPHYRQMIAFLSIINWQLQEGRTVPKIFSADRDIITAVQLNSDILWLDMAVTDGHVSFTCLGPTTKKLDAGRVLLFAA